MKIVIERYSESKKQTIGRGFVVNDSNSTLLGFDTLELPYLNNKKRKSCIPIGKYKVVKRYSNKFKLHFHILNVPNRDYILIHKGNFYTDIKGCILVGSDLKWLNNDSEVDLVNSAKTMKKLIKLLPNEFDLEIYNS